MRRFLGTVSVEPPRSISPETTELERPDRSDGNVLPVTQNEPGIIPGPDPFEPFTPALARALMRSRERMGMSAIPGPDNPRARAALAETMRRELVAAGALHADCVAQLSPDTVIDAWVGWDAHGRPVREP